MSATRSVFSAVVRPEWQSKEARVRQSYNQGTEVWGPPRVQRTQSTAKIDPFKTDCTFRDLIIHNHNHHYNLARYDTVIQKLGAVDPYVPPPPILQPIFEAKPRPVTAVKVAPSRPQPIIQPKIQPKAPPPEPKIVPKKAPPPIEMGQCKYCDETMEKKKVPPHEAKCEGNCKHCGDKMLWKLIPEHEKQCLVRCKYCKLEFLRKEIKKHEENCQLSCRHCGKKCLKQELKAHED